MLEPLNSTSESDANTSDENLRVLNASFSPPGRYDDVFGLGQLSLDDVATNPTFKERQAQVPFHSEVMDLTKVSSHHMLEDFVRSKTEFMLPIPDYFNEDQKQYMRQAALAMGLRVETWGAKTKISKKGNVPVKNMVRHLKFCENSTDKLEKLWIFLQNKGNDVGINMPYDQQDHRHAHQMKQGLLMFGAPKIPAPAKGNPLKEHREQLPIWKYKDQIVEMIQQNRISVIRSQTGYGKSTQIPQFIVEHCHSAEVPCRVLVCLPKRVSAIALADRVAVERKEEVGPTIGYQVRLESCISPAGSVISFCTGSVLLRALANPGNFLLDGVTHILMDEMQCRSKYQDIAMLILREIARSGNTNLKFVFVTDDLKADWMCEYLDAPKHAELLLPEIKNNSSVQYIDSVLSLETNLADGSKFKVYNPDLPLKPESLRNNAVVYNVDEMIHKVFSVQHVEETLHEFHELVRGGLIDPNYEHSENGVTMLMACAAHSHLDDIDKLMQEGASTDIRSNNGRTAEDWARSFNHHAAAEFISSWTAKQRSFNSGVDTTLYRSYQKSMKHDTVDIELVANLVKYVHVVDNSDGGILVFLPTYEALDDLYQKITGSCQSWCSRRLSVSLLHKYAQTDDQRLMFDRGDEQARNLIIAAGMFESGLTFPHLKFVIDTGKHAANSDLGSAGKSLIWISKTDAEQRLARLGNKQGTCFRLYSKRTFTERMLSHTVPEVMRCGLSSLCLYARSFLSKDVSMAEFFTYLPSPPSEGRVSSAVSALVQMGAIDKEERITELGSHLLDYPLDPRWAKAALYSCVFKCLDPILTLASYMAYEDAFRVPAHPGERRKAIQRKAQLSDGTFSDFMAILKAFHKWETERSAKCGDVSKLCETYYLTNSTFDIVYGIRTRLLGQLRASGFVRNQGKFDVKDLNKYSDNWAVVKAVLMMTLYPNICVASRMNKVFTQRDLLKIHAHNVSVLSPLAQYPHWKDSMPTDFVVYGRMMEGQNKYEETMGSIAECCAVNTATVALLAGEMTNGFHIRNRVDGYETIYVIDINDWLTLFGTNSVLHHLEVIRERIRCIIVRRLMRPDVLHSPVEDRILEDLAYILTQEDEVIGLQQSFGVGQWPKLVSGNLLSTSKFGTSSTGNEDDLDEY